MSLPSPSVIVFAGPNGAGKSSSASAILPALFPLDRLVNPDLIARGIAPDDSGAAALRAGRAAIEAISVYRKQRLDFAFETTLSGGWTRRAFESLLADGYDIALHFLWLPDPSLAIARVRGRAARGEHAVPETDVRRRFSRGLVRLEEDGFPLATRWSVRDARAVGAPALVAHSVRGHIQVERPETWAAVLQSIQVARDALSRPAERDSRRGG